MKKIGYHVGKFLCLALCQMYGGIACACQQRIGFFIARLHVLRHIEHALKLLGCIVVQQSFMHKRRGAVHVDVYRHIGRG